MQELSGFTQLKPRKIGFTTTLTFRRFGYRVVAVAPRV